MTFLDEPEDDLLMGKIHFTACEMYCNERIQVKHKISSDDNRHLLRGGISPADWYIFSK
jgi:hypothetical protein